MSHMVTVVTNCCKDDDVSLWEMAKVWPPPPRNPLTDRHQNFHKWLCLGYLSSRNISSRLNEQFRSCACVTSRIPFIFLGAYTKKTIKKQEAFEKCWAHSPLRAAARPFTRCRYQYCRMPPAHRCPRRQRRQRQRQRVTEGTAMAPWNGPNDGLNCYIEVSLVVRIEGWINWRFWSWDTGCWSNPYM